jgi:hypothetical protein
MVSLAVAAPAGLEPSAEAASPAAASPPNRVKACRLLASRIMTEHPLARALDDHDARFLERTGRRISRRGPASGRNAA